MEGNEQSARHVTEALAQIQERQERLARGEVAEWHDVPFARAETKGESRAQTRNRPPPARRRARDTKNTIVWITRTLQRWDTDGSFAESVGMLEFVRGATLADVRGLVEQFYPLPHHRAFEFFHPSLRIRIDRSDEVNIDPMGFEVLAVVALVHVQAAVPFIQTSSSGASRGMEVSPRGGELERLHKVDPSRKSVVVPVQSYNRGYDFAAKEVWVSEEERKNERKPTDKVRPIVSPDPKKRKQTTTSLQDAMKPEATVGAQRSEEEDEIQTVNDETCSSKKDESQKIMTTIRPSDTQRVVNKPEGHEKQRKLKAIKAKSSKSNSKTVQDTFLPRLSLKSDVEIPADVPKTDFNSPPTGEEYHPARLSNLDPASPLNTTDISIGRGDMVFRHDTTDSEYEAMGVGTDNRISPMFHSRSEDQTFLDDACEIPTHNIPVILPDVSLSTGQDGTQSKFTNEVDQFAPDSEPSKAPHDAINHPAAASQLVLTSSSPKSNGGDGMSTEGLEESISFSTQRNLNEPPVHFSTSNTGIEIEVEPTIESLPSTLPDIDLMNEAHISVVGSSPIEETKAGPSNTTGDGTTVDHVDISTTEPTTEQLGVVPALATNENTDATVFSGATTEATITEHLDTTKDVTIIERLDTTTTVAIHEYPPVSEDESSHASKYLAAVIGFFLKQFEITLHPSVSPTPTDGVKPSPLFSLAQIQESFKNYGTDHAVLMTNEVVLAMEEDMCLWSGAKWEKVENHFKAFLLSSLSRVGSLDAMTQAFRELQRFEVGLNFMVDILGWEKPTTIRLQEIECATDSTLEKLGGIGEVKTLIMSKADIAHFGSILRGLASGSLSDFERWLADALETMYFFLYSPLTATEKDLNRVIMSREQRIEWVIQKSRNATMWRRLNLRLHNSIEEYSVRNIFQNRLLQFRRGRHHMRKLEDAEVIRTITTFLSRKANDYTRSMTQFFESGLAVEQGKILQRFCGQMKMYMDHPAVTAEATESHLRDFGLKVTDLSSINKERQGQALARISLSGKLSLLTHHHTILHASSFRLYRKARWSLSEMQAGSILNRYMYHGDASVALEYVYIKHSLDTDTLGSRWEESMRTIEAEAASAFQLFGSPNTKKKNTLVGVGLNVLYSSWLHDGYNFDSLRTVLKTHPSVRKLSVGYHLSRNEAVAAVRITYRVHADAPLPIADGFHDSATETIIEVLDKFICSATNESLHRLLHFGGLQYVDACLRENRVKLWGTLKYGAEVRRAIVEAGSDIQFVRVRLLSCIQRLLFLIPQSDAHVTTIAVTLLEQLTKLGNDDAECAVAEAATRTFVSLAGWESPEAMTRVSSPREPSAIQKSFLAVDGFRRLKGGVDASNSSSKKRSLLEDALLAILTTTPFWTQESSLVHAVEWKVYLIDSQAWSRSSWHESILIDLLAWIHTNFFATKYVERDRMVCCCGCRGFSSGQFSALMTILELYAALMRVKPGNVWVNEQLTMPLDLLHFVEWACTRKEAVVEQTSTAIVFDTLIAILSDQHLSRDMWPHVSSVLGTKIMHVVQMSSKEDTKVLLLGVWGLLFEGCIKYSVWEVAPKHFVSFVLSLANAMTSDGGSGTQISSMVTDLVLRQEGDIVNIHQSGNLSSYLVKEHANCSNSSARQSILQSLALLLSVACEDTEEHFSWVASLLVGLIALFGNKNAVIVLQDIGVEEALHAITINDRMGGDRILAERALAIFYAQILQCSWWRPSEHAAYARVCNVLSNDVQNSIKRTFPRTHIHIHVGDNGIPLYGREIQDMPPMLERMNQLIVSEATPRGRSEWERAYLEELWRDHSWLDGASVERLITHLKLLLVFSRVPKLMELQQITDEMSQLLRSLCKFIRDRSHIPDYQLLLYVSVIDNLSAYYGKRIQEFDMNSSFNTRFFERLLLYSRRPDALLSMAAARCLWSLSSAFRDRDLVFKHLRVPVSMIEDSEVEMASSATIYGIDVLIGSITSSLRTNCELEGNAGTLSTIVEHNAMGAQYFLSRYRLVTVTKFLNEARIIRVSHKPHPFTPLRLRSGPHVYDMMVTRSEKDMIQLCRLASCCLATIARSEAAKKIADQTNADMKILSPDRDSYFTLDVEFGRIKSSIVPLLFDNHPLILDEVVRCVLVPLVTHLSRCTDVLDASALDRLVHLALHHDYSPLQARALSATRAAVGNSKMSDEPYRLSEKLFAKKAALVMCLSRENFEVTKQAIELMAILISKNDEPRRRYEFAALFRTESHQRALVHALGFLCQRKDQSDAGVVLQRLVSFIIQLQLVQLIDSDLMVEAMTMALTSHREQAFLRPMICGCLRDIARQPGTSIHFVNPSRLDPILSLLQASLTNGEARDLGIILHTLASENPDIRTYLRQAKSHCMPGLAAMMSSFARVSAEDLSHKPLRRILALDFDPDDMLIEETQGRNRQNDLEDGRQAIRTTIDSHTFISAFADDVYEEILNLLLVLLAPYEFAEERYGCTCGRGCDACEPCDLFAIAHGPRAISNLLFACRVLTHVDDTNQRLIQAAAVEAFTIVRLALHVLIVASTNHNCRMDIMSDPVTGNGESTLVWLMSRSRPSDMHEFHQVAELTDNALQTLAHCCAESNAARIVFSYEQFTVSLFKHLLIRRNDAQAIPCQRTATFLISRLAETRKYYRHPLFQEKVLPVLSRIDDVEDTVMQSNLLILSRNLGEHLPNNRLMEVILKIFRTATVDANASTLVACEVLAYLLLVRSSYIPHKEHRAPALSQTRKLQSRIGPFRLTTTPICSFLYKRLRTDFESREYLLLIDETAKFASQIWPSDDVTDSMEAMLDFLVIAHLGGVTDSLGESIIDNCRVRTHTPALQYLTSTADQNAPEPPDVSFAGTAHLWRFIRKLWHTCNTRRLLCGKRQPKPHLERIVATFQKWRELPVSLVSSLERRQRLVAFTNVLLTANHGTKHAFQVNDTVMMLEDFVTRFGSIGDGYELLHILCKANPTIATWLVDHIAKGASKALPLPFDYDRTGFCRQQQPFARKLWSAVHPRYYSREGWISKATSKDPHGDVNTATADARLRGIDASGPGSSTELAFAVAMLNTLIRHSAAVLTSYLKAHSMHVLLDMLLLTSESAIELTTAHHVWVSNLIQVFVSCVLLDVNVTRFFIADPRLLASVVRHIYSTNIEVQAAGLELLIALAKPNTSIICLLRRAEDWTEPSCSVESWMISVTQLRLARLRLHGVQRRQANTLTHLVQVPLFSRVKTLDLARVSTAFALSGLVDRGHFMVLSGNSQFDPPPDWLNTRMGATDSKDPPQLAATLSRIVEAKKSSGQRVALFETSKERFLSRSTLEARSAIASEIFGYYSHSREGEDKLSPLVRRLCRFLVEDRAELLRRVMYVKHLDLGVATALLPSRWNDTLRLLIESPLMQDISRDSLACLALSMGEPAEITGQSIFENLDSTWRFYLLHSEHIDYEVYVLDAEDSIQTTRRLHRGDIVVPATVARTEITVMAQATLAKRVSVWEVTQSQLETSLSVSEIDLIKERTTKCEVYDVQCANVGNCIQGFGVVKSNHEGTTRLRLQQNALTLLRTLIEQNESYAHCVAIDQKTISTLVHIACSCLSASLIQLALEVMIALVVTLRNPAFLTRADHKLLEDTFPSDSSGLGFAVVAVRGALELEQGLVRSLRLMRVIFEAQSSSWNRKTAVLVAECLSLVLSRVLETDKQHASEVVEEVLLLISKMVGSEHQGYLFKGEGTTSKLPSSISQLLPRLSTLCIGPAALAAFLEVIVFLDQDTAWKNFIQSNILTENSQFVLKTVAADLLVHSRGAMFLTEASINIYLAFIESFSSHVLEARAERHRTCQDAGLIDAARVLLTAFSRLVRPHHVLLRVMGKICEAAPTCVRPVASAKILISKRTVTFYRFVYTTFQAFPPSHTWRRHEEALSVVRCVRVLSPFARAAHHFVGEGFVDLGMSYLQMRATDASRQLAYATVCGEILLSFKALVEARCIAPGVLLHEHHLDLRGCMERASCIADNRLRSQLLTAFFNMLTTVVDTATQIEDTLTDVTWLTADVMTTALGVLHILSQERKLEKHDLRLVHASTSFLCAISCSSAQLTMLINSHNFAKQLETLCGGIVMPVLDEQVRLDFLRFVCLVMERLTADQTLCSENLLTVFVQNLLPAINGIASQTVEAEELYSLLPVSLRVQWLLLYLALAKGFDVAEAIEAIIHDRSSALERVAQSQPTVRMILNSLGLVGTLARLLVHRSGVSEHTYDRIVDVTFKLISTNKEAIGSTIEVTPPTNWGEMGWNVFAYHFWDDESPSLGFELHQLVVISLRRIISHPMMWSAWVQRDPHLELLRSVGLPVALRLLGLRAPVASVLFSIMKKCIVFIHEGLRLVMHRLESETARSWRRTLRQRALVDAMVWCIQTKECDHEVVLRGIALLTTYIGESIPNVMSLCRYYHDHGINVFVLIVSLVLRELHSMHSRRWIMIQVCLLLIEEATRNVYQASVLAASAIGDVSVFISKICSCSNESEGYADAVGTLFRSLTSVVRHVKLEGEMLAVGVTIQNLSSHHRSGTSPIWFSAAFALVVHLTMKGESSHLANSLLDVSFWKLVEMELRRRNDIELVDGICQICTRVIKNQRASKALANDTALREAIEKTIISVFTVGGQRGASVLVSWLHLSLPRQSKFMRVVCESVLQIQELPASQQVGLVLVLPSLLVKLKNSNRLDQLGHDVWLVIRDLGLQWAKSDRDPLLLRASYSAFRILLMARHVRLMHDAAAKFRAVFAHWRALLGIEPLSGRQVDLGAVTQIDSLPVEMVEVMIAVCSALGLTLDQETVISRVVMLWLESFFYTEGSWRLTADLLELVYVVCVDDTSQVRPPLVAAITSGSDIAAHSLIRVILWRGRIACVGQRVVGSILLSNTGRAVMRRLLLGGYCDLVDRCAWELYNVGDKRRSIDLSIARIESVTLLSADSRVAERVLRRRVLDEWVCAIAYCDDHNRHLYEAPVNQAMLALISAVFRRVRLDEYRSSQTWKPLILYALHCVLLEGRQYVRLKSHALEILTTLIQVDHDLMIELWRACHLSDYSSSTGETARGIVLRAITELLCTGATTEDRRRAAFVVYSLSASPERIAPLIRARDEVDPDGNMGGFASLPLCELLTRALFFSVGTRISHTLRTNPHEWTSTASMFPLPIDFTLSDTAVWVLRVLHKCLRDKSFVRALAVDIDVLEQVFAAAACPAIEVSTLALRVVRDAAIRSTRSGRRQYRQLDFFSDLRVHDAIAKIVPTAAGGLPTCFVVLELWVKYYGHHVGELEGSSDSRQHFQTVLEVMLCILSQHFAQVFHAPVDAAERDRHTELCKVLTHILCSLSSSVTAETRLLVIAVLTTLCAFASNQYSVAFFADTAQLERLLLVIETSSSEEQRKAVVGLIGELAWVGAIKALFGHTSSALLRRLVVWLGESGCPSLQACATTIIRYVIVKSTGAQSEDPLKRKEALEQHQTMLHAVANAMFVPESNQPREHQSQLGGTPTVRIGEARVELKESHLREEKRTTSVVLHISVLDRHRSSLREFRYRGKLRLERPLLIHEVVLEDSAAILNCELFFPDQKQQRRTKSSAIDALSHRFSLNVSKPDRAEVSFPPVSTVHGDHLRVALHYRVRHVETTDRGVLGSLLAEHDVKQQVVTDGLAIITELAKNHAVFCRPDVSLGRHMLAGMEASLRLSQTLDLAPLNALTVWFWSKTNSVAHFRTSSQPLLWLIQHMRNSALPRARTALHSVEINPHETGPTFLASLVDWLATLESDSLTDNCINVLFFENQDILMALASHFFPKRSARASFFYLVAMVVRVNRVHCEVFSRRHAVQMLIKLIDDTAPDPSRPETLRHAARVIAKIARSHPAAEKFQRHGGMRFFGRIAQAVLCDQDIATWDVSSSHLRAAAENLVIAASFFCETAASTIRLSEKTTMQRVTLEICSRCDADFDEMQARLKKGYHMLSLVEALLIFLAVSDKSRQRRGIAVASSIDRLAAIVLRALIEKWPSRSHFENSLVVGMHNVESQGVQMREQLFELGLRRCIQLTQWDFFSQLHIVRRAYSSAVSSGVQTGVIPTKCRSILQPFDDDFLDQLRNATIASSRIEQLTNSRQATSQLAFDRDVMIDREREIVDDFVQKHSLLVETLSEHRKKTLTSRIRKADGSARVALGVHDVLTVIHDAFVDALEVSFTTPAVPFRMTLPQASSIMVQWLLLLEQLFGLLCCSFNELDAVYYGEVFRQMHVLLASELPAFLLKMERVQSRQETISMVLNNLERLLRRLTNKHELRGVTSTGVGISQDAKKNMDDVAAMKDQVSEVLGMALSCRDGVDRLHRGIIAAEYAWRRVFSGCGDSITAFMEGRKDSESLWVKIRGIQTALMTVLMNPGPILRARWKKLQNALAALVAQSDEVVQQHAQSYSMSLKVDADVSSRSPQIDDDEESDLKQQQERDKALASQLGLASMSDVLTSNVPHVSLELLLDHYGYASSGVKKQIALLSVVELRPLILQAFANALEREVAAVALMQASQLEYELRMLQSKALRVDGDRSVAEGAAKRLSALFQNLRDIVEDADLGVQLRVIVEQPIELTLWQFLMAPVLRARLFLALDHVTKLRQSSDRKRTRALEHAFEDSFLRYRDVQLDALTLSTTDDKSAREPQLTIKSAAQPGTNDVMQRWTLPSWKVAAGTNNSPSATSSAGTDGLSKSSSIIVDLADIVDPLSDASLIQSLKRELENRRQQQLARQASVVHSLLGHVLPSAGRYNLVPSLVSRVISRVTRRLAVLTLVLAFWRQEELESDLKNDVYAKAFSSAKEREEYFLARHIRKAFTELIRVWMPESGTLGLPLWHWRSYGVCGTMLCIVLACVSPHISSNASYRNDVMTWITYSLVVVILLLSAKSMSNIADRQFVLQERNRLRLQPIAKYYQNLMGIKDILVDIVQLNSITFDPAFDWNKTDQIPKFIQLMGNLGISSVGIAQVELKAAFCAFGLGLWFILLKCANKFQESSPSLNRRVTKDLPSLLNGTLYMGFIATFFSFLSCVDCSDETESSPIIKCKNAIKSGITVQPFLLSHQNIACWTSAHVWYAFLGFWGVAFFMPIGLLSEGMNHVLFEEEALDIKFAPVIKLFSQLIKAASATAHAFFPFNKRVLVSLALSGNLLLFAIMMWPRRHTKIASLWHIQYVKGGIYAASAWSAGVAIYRLDSGIGSSEATNLVYMGWLGIGALTATFIKWHVRVNEKQHHKDTRSYLSSQRALVTSAGLRERSGTTLTPYERHFLEAAAAVVAAPQPTRRVRSILEEAARLSEDHPPQLHTLMQRARAFASGQPKGSSVSEAVFMQNSRRLARKIEARNTSAFVDAADARERLQLRIRGHQKRE